MIDPVENCTVLESCDAIELLLKPHEKDLGDFTVRRTLPSSKRQMVGPWIFFDHMGPATFQPGEGINVRPHPHVNIATVTYLFDGEILHRDSLGSIQAIRPGDINLMVTGSGIVHSERERAEVNSVEHRLHGLQLWMALPVADEETDAAFYHYPSRDIPSATIDGVPIRVMMGSAFDLASPVKTFAETLYVEAEMKAGQALAVPPAEERALYVASGSVRVGETEIPEHSLAVFSARDDIVIESIGDARIAIIGGDNVGDRFIEWNFVSSRQARIEQAKQDWKDGKFPKVPGDEEEFIPLPD